MPLFGKSQKSPAELVRSLKDAVTALERGDKKAEKAQEDVSKNLVSGKTITSVKIVLLYAKLIDQCKLNCVLTGTDKEHAVWHL